MERAHPLALSRRIAVVGLAFRFPGPGGDAFWDALCEGRNLVTTVNRSRWALESFAHPRKPEPGRSYTFAAGSLGDVSGFDAAFFGISPREAAQVDPQQRLLLELTWEALESGGIPPSSMRGTRGSVHVGFSGSDYSYLHGDDLAAVDSFTMPGMTASIAANRISYCFDLRGPSMAVDTACSSSLVALHQACQSLLAGESELAVAGAVNLHLHPMAFIAFSKATMLSRRGVCRPFDADGDGYVRSEGGAIVILKRLSDALAAGDRIYAVVSGSGINCDGKTSSLTVPSSEAQAALLREVYARSGIDPAEVDYLEAHGTGTAVGDPIEARALGEALGRLRPAGLPLRIGSVKSNLGHLESAAGMAGLVKSIYCLRHRAIPPSIHFERPNPRIAFRDWNLEVVSQVTPLEAGKRLVIGINSFGFGGANAHVVLESAPQAQPAAPRAPQAAAPLLVSARSQTALKAAARDLAGWLRERPGLELYDLAWSTAFHRDWHEHRALAVGADREALAAQLAAFARGEEAPGVIAARALAKPGTPVFVYSGNGSQWAGMGRKLLAADAGFRASLEAVDACFRPRGGFSIVEELQRDELAGRLEATEVAQPLLFALQVAITGLLARWGVVPGAALGHSVGEIAAAWACGALSLKQAVEVVIARSAAQARTRGAGAMTAVALPEAEARSVIESLGLRGRAGLAAVNSPRSVTVSGERPALEALEAALAARGATFRRLDLDYAFHSALMDPIRGEVERSLAGLAPRPAHLPFHSTVTGEALAGEALDGAYWWRNIREPVRFGPALGRLIAGGAAVFVEVGPQPVLRGYVAECLGQSPGEGVALPTMARAADGPEAIRAAALRAMLAGCPTDLARLYPVQGRFVDLPHYPWQRERHWYAPTAEGHQTVYRRVGHPLLGARSAHGDCEWESHLDTCIVPALADHRVGGQCVLPATGFAEMALAAGLEVHGVESLELEDLEIRAPLLLEEQHAKTVRFTLDPADGSFTVRARERLSTDSWRVHARGRVRPAATPPRAPRLAGTAPGDAVPAEEHYRMTAAVGLEYGPAFRRVALAWREGEAALAELEAPAALREDVAPPLLHPASLDCCLQLLVHLVQGEARLESGVALVPVRIGRLRLHRARAPAKYARIEARRRGARSVVADCALYDESGEPLATLAGVRFHAAPLGRESARALTFIENRRVLRPLGAAPAAFPALDALAAACAARLHGAARLRERARYYADVEPLLEAMLAAFAQQALAAVAGGHGARAALRARLQELAGEAALPPAREIWGELLARFPDHAREIVWLARIGLHLPELLQGTDWSCPPLATPPDLARALAGALGEALEALPEARRLRVLLVDSANTQTAMHLLGALDFERCDCVLLCADEALLEKRRALAARHPGVVVRQFDPEQPEAALPPEAAEPFDLVVLEAFEARRQDFARVLGRLRPLAAPGATLAVLEHAASRAALPGLEAARPASGGHWAFGARRLRSVDSWAALLAAHGFGFGQVVTECPAAEPCSYLLLAPAASAQAAAPAPAMPGRWVVLAEAAQPLAPGLAAALCGLGAEVEIVDPERPGELRARLEGARGVVHLHALGAQLEDQAARCESVKRMLDALAESGEPPACWVVTSQAHLRPDEAVTWGLVRSAINEYPQLALALVDLEAPGSPAAPGALAATLLGHDGEDEVVLAADGRYALRLQPVEPHACARAAAPGAAAREVLRLELPAAGQIKNLRWARQPLPAPAEDEVEIEVRAAGLNFRDVMFAMGQLPDEALENGFAGASLGMELAGVVAAAGARVGGLRPGDEVIAFAPASFGTRVLTKADAVVRKPAGWSFEAAATVPVAFLTAYYALKHLAQLEEGQKVLIHGAAGGVGIASIQIARNAGAEIYATAGSEAKRDFLRLLGADHVLDSRSLAFADEVMERTAGRGVDVVVNSLAGEAMARSLAVLRPFGRFLELGKRDFYENTRVGLRPLRNNVAYFGIDADQLLLERPGLTRRMLEELMAQFAEGRLAPLPFRAFPAADAIEAFRFMQQSKQIGKIVLGFDPPPAARRAAAGGEPARLRLDPQASYLVTGGLRGFGLRTAQWLAGKGARHLVLVGRGGAPEESRAALDALAASGVQARVARCDVADRGALEALLEELRASMPPLRGVVHAAAVIQDGLIRNLTREQLRANLGAKALGAVHLDALTRGMELDFFVLYSSATTLFGNPGQAAYVAANCALESLAAARRAEGLPALAVGWGPIADAGYLARHPEVREALEARIGGPALAAEEALGVLERLLLEGSPERAVLRFDRGMPRFLAAARAPKYRPLAARFDKLEDAAGEKESLARWLEQLDDAELAALFGDIVRKEVGAILRLPPERIDMQRPLQDLGLDSLMGVELMTAVEQRFGVNIPVMAMSDVGTIERLVERIIRELRRARASAEPAPQAGVDETIRTMAAAHAVGASPAEVAAFTADFKATAK